MIVDRVVIILDGKECEIQNTTPWEYLIENEAEEVNLSEFSEHIQAAFEALWGERPDVLFLGPAKEKVDV